ncbi:MAG: ATP cone domain-containing protein [Halothiobacillaceae bacterium]
MVDVVKSGGRREPFDESKLRLSLRRAGAGDDDVEAVVHEVRDRLHEGITTGKVYRLARQALKRRSRRVAITYSLKRALLELGPSGYPFEQFCGRLFEAMGYSVAYNQTFSGRCVQHEIDVVAERDGQRLFAECKFHNRQGHRNDVKIPLYVQGRAQDLADGEDGHHHEFWILTNTVFSEDALCYGRCVGLRLAGHNTDHFQLTRDLINQHRLHPVTCLTRLKAAHKRILLDNRLVLCRELLENPSAMDLLGLDDAHKGQVLAEARDIIAVGQVRRRP